ncbi:hypothetical protein H4219_004039 [Mycoemilia scoparia]|uniref:Uncharacterized protein n=1 Tax=Mycoemilia scoparia TaxID=417184 RepID=A0A9W7ZXC6_9FUNG|nr:hypothetical protein H4219_004039 [Mycoemilia scoparia]
MAQSTYPRLRALPGIQGPSLTRLVPFYRSCYLHSTSRQLSSSSVIPNISAIRHSPRPRRLAVQPEGSGLLYRNTCISLLKVDNKLYSTQSDPRKPKKSHIPNAAPSFEEFEEYAENLMKHSSIQPLTQADLHYAFESCQRILKAEISSSGYYATLPTSLAKAKGARALELADRLFQNAWRTESLNSPRTLNQYLNLHALAGDAAKTQTLYRKLFTYRCQPNQDTFQILIRALLSMARNARLAGEEDISQKIQLLQFPCPADVIHEALNRSRKLRRRVFYLEAGVYTGLAVFAGKWIWLAVGAINTIPPDYRGVVSAVMTMGTIIVLRLGFSQFRRINSDIPLMRQLREKSPESAAPQYHYYYSPLIDETERPSMKETLWGHIKAWFISIGDAFGVGRMKLRETRDLHNRLVSNWLKLIVNEFPSERSLRQWWKYVDDDLAKSCLSITFADASRFIILADKLNCFELMPKMFRLIATGEQHRLQVHHSNSIQDSRSTVRTRPSELLVVLINEIQSRPRVPSLPEIEVVKEVVSLLGQHKRPLNLSLYKSLFGFAAHINDMDLALEWANNMKLNISPIPNWPYSHSLKPTNDVTYALHPLLDFMLKKLPPYNIQATDDPLAAENSSDRPMSAKKNPFRYEFPIITYLLDLYSSHIMVPYNLYRCLTSLVYKIHYQAKSEANKPGQQPSAELQYQHFQAIFQRWLESAANIAIQVHAEHPYDCILGTDVEALLDLFASAMRYGSLSSTTTAAATSHTQTFNMFSLRVFKLATDTLGSLGMLTLTGPKHASQEFTHQTIKLFSTIALNKNIGSSGNDDAALKEILGSILGPNQTAIGIAIMYMKQANTLNLAIDYETQKLFYNSLKANNRLNECSLRDLNFHVSDQGTNKTKEFKNANSDLSSLLDTFYKS